MTRPTLLALIRLKKQIEAEFPTVTPNQANQLAALAVGCSETAIRNWFKQYSLVWAQAPKEYTPSLCEICGKRALARNLCNTHYSQFYRASPPPARQRKEKPKGDPAAAIRDCPATDDKRHMWVIHENVRICFHCREPFSIIRIRRKKCSTKSQKPS